MHYKIQTNVPKESLEDVRLAMGNAGAGVIGNYTHCAFVMPGVGYFLPGEGANPLIGAVGMMETVEEYKLEFVCDAENIAAVIKALKQSHPYEEPPIEIFTLVDLSAF